jgi:hypothetical protein
VEYFPYGLYIVNTFNNLVLENLGDLPSRVVDKKRPLLGLCQAI